MWNFEQTVEAEFLPSRCLALELAAVLDRLDEAARREGRTSDHPRLKCLREAIAVLAAPSSGADRVERILRAYSQGR